MDYAGDKYVHRLVTNESDGKLVELPDKDDKLNGGSSTGMIQLLIKSMKV